MFHCKVENKKEKLEDFKTAISSTVRSISNSQNVEVFLEIKIQILAKKSIKLPDLQKTNDKINFEEIRAIADSKSLRFRFSNEHTLKNMSQLEIYPKDSMTSQKKLDEKLVPIILKV